MKIQSFGCSFLAGSDLESPEHTWPAVIARELGISHENRSHGATGNFRICNGVLRHCRSGQSSIVLINWTYIDRFDYADSESDNLSWKCLLPSDRSCVAESYYKYLNSHFVDKWKSLSYVKLAIDHLNDNGIPFVMTYMDHLLTETQYHTNPAIESFQKQVLGSLKLFDGKNFLEWSQEKKFKISRPGNHPLEAAHAAAAEFWLSTVSDLINRINSRS